MLMALNNLNVESLSVLLELLYEQEGVDEEMILGVVTGKTNLFLIHELFANMIFQRRTPILEATTAGQCMFLYTSV